MALATGGGNGGAPPEHAQGGKREVPPAAQQAPAATRQGKAKGHAKKGSMGGQVQSGGDAHGKSGGGHDKARGNGHTKSHGGSGGQAGGQSGGSGGEARSGGGSEHAKAGKVTLCHATRSETNPYVTITISANAVPAHERHQDGRDIIPAPAGGCPGGSSGGENGVGRQNEHGKVTLCHATGSETNPYVVITISENALDAHLAHQDGQDIYPVPEGGCPSTALSPTLGNPPSGLLSPAGGGDEGPAVLGVSEVGGSAPAGDEDAGGVLGANQGGGEEPRETSGGSLPFTGLGLGLLAALGLALLVGGSRLRRTA